MPAHCRLAVLALGSLCLAQQKPDIIRGSIKVGKLADVVVVDRNIVERPEELLQMEIDMTIVDGRIVFEREK